MGGSTTLGEMAADGVHEQTGKMFDCSVATKRRPNEMKGHRIKLWKIECAIEAGNIVGHVNRSARYQAEACFRRSPNRRHTAARQCDAPARSRPIERIDSLLAKHARLLEYK